MLRKIAVDIMSETVKSGNPYPFLLATLNAYTEVNNAHTCYFIAFCGHK